MILNEGIRVKMGADNTELLQAFRSGNVAAFAFKGAVVGALSAVASQSVRMAAQLDKDLRLVQTLGGEAATSVGQLRHEIGELSKEFGRSQNELARANYQAASGGFKEIAESMKVTTAGAKLAVAGNSDIVTSTEAVVKALNAFDIAADQSNNVAAVLWATTRDGIITTEQLSRFLSDLPVSVKSSGMAIEEMTSAVATLTSEGVPASTAIDQLRSAIIQFETRGITGSLVDRVERFAGQGLGEIVKQVGDQTAARGILVLANNIDKLRENTASAYDVLTDYEAGVATMNSGAMAEWSQATERLNDAMSDLGTTVLPGVATAMSGIATVMDKVVGLINKIPDRSWAVLAMLSGGGANLWMMGGGGSSGGGATGSGGSPSASWPGVASFGSAWMPPHLYPNAPADIPYSVPFTIDTMPMPPIAYDPFAGPTGGRAEAARYGYGAVGALGPGSNPFPNLGANMDDFIVGLGDVEVGLESVQGASMTATAAAGILSSSIGGLLTSAFVTADSAAGRFVQGLLAQFAQLGVTRLLGSAFGLPGFATGGYTGSMGGMVHANEYVFSASAVKALGLGSLDRAHEVAKVGGANVTINQTVNGGNPTQVAQVTKHAVESAIRESNSTGTNRLYRSGAGRWR